MISNVFVFLKDSSCTLLSSAGLFMCQKGTQRTFIQGLWRYTRPFLLRCALMKLVLSSFQSCVSSERNPQSFIWCFVVFKTCSFEHMNKRECEHVWGQPRGLAAFFYPANDCIFIFFVSSLLKTFLCNMLTTVSSISSSAQRIDAAQWQTALADCLTAILRVMSRVDLFLDLTWLPEATSTVPPEESRTVASYWNGSERQVCHHVPAPSVMSRIKKPMHISVNWVFTLLGCQN